MTKWEEDGKETEKENDLRAKTRKRQNKRGSIVIARLSQWEGEENGVGEM